jgi:hypothetical protein
VFACGVDFIDQIGKALGVRQTPFQRLLGLVGMGSNPH